MSVLNMVILVLCVLIASFRLSDIMVGDADAWTWLSFVYFLGLALVYVWLAARRRESPKG